MIRLTKIKKRNVFYQIDGDSYFYFMKNILCHNKHGIASRDVNLGDGIWCVNGVLVCEHLDHTFEKSFLLYWKESFFDETFGKTPCEENISLTDWDDFESDWEFKRALKYAKLFAKKRFLKMLKKLKIAYCNKDIREIGKLLSGKE